MIDNNLKGKMKNIITNDGHQLKVQAVLLAKFSCFIKKVLEDDEGNDEIKLFEVDLESFQQILKFMNTFKDKDPTSVKYPLKPSSNINQVMDLDSSQWVAQLLNHNDDLELFKKVLEASVYLQAQQIKKRLIAGLTLLLNKTTLIQLQQQNGLNEINYAQLIKERRQKLQNIMEMKEDQQKQ